MRARVIYYARTKQDEMWLLTLYRNNVAENIPSHVLRQIKKEIDDEKDKSSNIGNEILHGLRELKRGSVGRVLTYAWLAETRARVGLSQIEFARLLGVSVRRLQEWEQERRAPSGPARTLLAIAHKNRQAMLDAV